LKETFYNYDICSLQGLLLSVEFEAQGNNCVLVNMIKFIIIFSSLFVKAQKVSGNYN